MTARDPLHVVYLSPGTAMFGGVKVVLHQANLLHRRGHRVSVVSTGGPPDWFPLESEYHAVERLEPGVVPGCDVCVATYWTTIPVAAAAPCRRAVHYCQGFEGSFGHNRREHPAIEEAYRTPLPAMVVSPHLTGLLAERFGREAKVIPQPLEPFWRPRLRIGPRRSPRILVPGPFEIEWKGVKTGLLAVQELRKAGLEVRLVRLSQWPLSAEERAVAAPDEFHHRLLPRSVAKLMAGCDLMLAPSWEQEGFGLPALEAMACGLPVVASDIPSFRGFAAEAGPLVPFDSPAAFAGEAEGILAIRSRWRSRRRRGLRVAKGFSEKRSADAAERALRGFLEEA